MSGTVSVPEDWLVQLRKLAHETLDLTTAPGVLQEVRLWKAAQLLGYVDSVQYLLKDSGSEPHCTDPASAGQD